MDVLNWLLSLVLGGNWVDHQSLVRFAYDDSYHKSLSMTVCKVLCNNHAGCPNCGKNQTSMSLWISGHKRCNKKVYTYGEGLMTTKGYLRIVKTFQVNSGLGI